MAKKAVVEPLRGNGYDTITKARYFFNWKTESDNRIYRLRLLKGKEALGLMSLRFIEEEQRVEIVLLAVSKENRGKNKQYEGIAGNLIAWAAREAIRLFAENGCVSLLPKTKLKAHYMQKYGMMDAGRHVFLEGASLLSIIKKYSV